MIVDTSAYSRVLLLDTQMIFEARPLEQLPWHEMSSEAILLLVTTQVMTEVDGKKRDGRLGQRARAFNRLIEPNVESGTPTTILSGPPRVDLAFVSNDRVDWAALDDLEDDNGDDRMIAQALSARIDRPLVIEVLSFDARPRAAARRHGLAAIRPNESWLLQTEPSPAAKRVAELEQRIAVLSATQPQPRVTMRIVGDQPLDYFDVAPLDEDASKKLLHTVRRCYPKAHFEPFLSMHRTPSYDLDYAEWAEALAERDIPNIHAGLAQFYSQHEIVIELSNEGQVPAEHLCLDFHANDCRLHPGPIEVLVFGPIPPSPDANLLSSAFAMEDLRQHRNRDEFYRDSHLDSSTLKFLCGDFRHGRFERFSIYLGLGRAVTMIQLEARLTAANMRGDVSERLLITSKAVPVAVQELVNLDKLTFERDASAFGELLKRIDADNVDDVALFRNDGHRIKRRR